MIFNILLILILIIVITYLFGIIIIKIIDKKLSNISVNIPQQDIIIKYPEVEQFENKDIKEQTPFKYDKEYYNTMNKNNLVNGYNNKSESFKGWEFEEKEKQVCYKNHVHTKDGHNTGCSYGVTNYADPKDLSQMDYKIFVLNYPSNMTLQDYINWLFCYMDKEDQLPYNHLRNLKKLKMGKELKEEAGVLPPPGYYYPPLNSKDYFDKLYNDKNEFSIASSLNSTTAPMIGYNYDEYSEFQQNMDLYGSTGTLRNKDIGKKKNAKKLYNYINPRDSNSININNETQIYRMKNIEI